MTANCPPGYTPVADGFTAPPGMVLGRAIVDQGVTAAYWICAPSQAGQGLVESLGAQAPIPKTWHRNRQRSWRRVAMVGMGIIDRWRICRH